MRSKVKKTIVQDDTRERQLRDYFGLSEGDGGREGVDALDETFERYELKSTTKKSVSTTRLVGLHTIQRWRKLQWIIGIGENHKTGFLFNEIYYLPPSRLEPWFSKVEWKIKVYNKVCGKVNNIVINDLSSEERVIFNKIMKMGSLLNDPNIPLTFVRKVGTKMVQPYYKSLREALEPIDYSQPVPEKIGLERFCDI